MALTLRTGDLVLILRIVLDVALGMRFLESFVVSTKIYSFWVIVASSYLFIMMLSTLILWMLVLLSRIHVTWSSLILSISHSSILRVSIAISADWIPLAHHLIVLTLILSLSRWCIHAPKALVISLWPLWSTHHPHLVISWTITRRPSSCWRIQTTCSHLSCSYILICRVRLRVMKWHLRMHRRWLWSTIYH